ncbi:hypothetical protein COCCADRAFT_41699 [Bipolaris zeicola 26-R-13]|uniref:Uncharacterized protein n=1 Tax=Cochliobolus carbonum (strain 26-R-13) TaxID=930089 RepID=W6XPY6_COCC2|nr:uncharacterized protein COCCADRAFT_41699 [Bipolaris zeicola 26-R-13]EUC27628.1 hypothetical protein COCCADRAFT_41699 [Bipolaris zeicola 26-R-13]
MACWCLCASCMELHRGAKITQVAKSGPSLFDHAGDDIAYKIPVPVVSAPLSRRTLRIPATAVGDAANRRTQVHAPQRIKVSYEIG